MKVPVLLPKIFNYPLTYNCTFKKELKPGEFVEVPFGKKVEVGVVWDSLHSVDKKIDIKNVIKKIDGIFISKKMIKFINFFSIYNMVSKGLVLKMCIGNSKNYSHQDEEIKEKKIVLNKDYTLNKEQKVAFNELKRSGNKYSVSVLQGTTGSGKTIVYFEIIKEIIKKKKQALVLLPEIFLTNQFKERFLDFFGFLPAVWHSRITPKNKRIIWNRIINNKEKLVIGARSSLLLPFKNLGIIIVDEEHDASYKQDEGLIYNARDMAISRASIEDIPINLITSIPSLETFKNIKNKKFQLTKITKRYNNYPLPKTKIINLNLIKIKKNFIADETVEIVNKYLKKNEQVLFFLNRRGYAPFLICKVCGFKHSCPYCSVYLTYHKTLEKMVCHYCGYKNNSRRVCVDKKTFCNFIMYGPGVEKVFEELKEKFPNKNIKIFSSDYLKKKKEVEKIFENIKNNKINILIGTQMVSKGFNFPKLNCIVVVDADFSGKGYDLRTTERNIQLYNQLSGRAGRFSEKSLIIYQTLTPSNLTLDDIVKNNFEDFLENELSIRKQNKLPPFQRLIAIIVSSKSKEFSFKGAQEIKIKILKNVDVDVLGPVDSPVFRVKKMYRTRLLIRSKNDQLIQKSLIKTLGNLKISSKIKLRVDVDPINFN